MFDEWIVEIEEILLSEENVKAVNRTESFFKINNIGVLKVKKVNPEVSTIFSDKFIE